MKTHVDSVDSPQTGGNGNTKSLPVNLMRSRKWVFTYNNYTNEEYDRLINSLDSKNCEYTIGKEVGKEGTPHLQGYLNFKYQRTFEQVKLIMPKAHIEKCRSAKHGEEYCRKDGEFVTNIKPVIKPVTGEEMRIQYCLENDYKDVVWKPWQKEIVDLCKSKPDNRKVHWYWEESGNAGKSYLAKFLVMSENAIIAEGKEADINNQIKAWLDANPTKNPNIVIIDLPRSKFEYLNYGMIEKVKGGLLYSGKYEGGRCIFPSPHIVIFANEPPELDKLSADRWIVKNINPLVQATEYKKKPTKRTNFFLSPTE